MKAITFHGPGDLRVETVADPRIVEPTDVIVKVVLTAICGSDLHVYCGREPGLDLGTVMGHEFVGEVVEAGPDVRSLTCGDVVLSPFSTSCGRCFYCREGLTSRCVEGKLFGWIADGEGLQGAQAELARVPLADSTLIPVPPGITVDEALLLGDVMSTGYYCAQQAGVRPGGTYVVLGCGPVGLSAIVGVRELGADRIFAVDSVEERLNLAESFGATPIDFCRDDVAAVLSRVTDGRGADAVLEVVGNSSAHRAAVDLVRPGGTISVVGVHNEAQFAFSPAEAYDKNLTYRVGRCPARSVAPLLFDAVRSRKHDLSAIISHRLPLDRGAAAYPMFDEKRDGCTKVVLEP